MSKPIITISYDDDGGVTVTGSCESSIHGHELIEGMANIIASATKIVEQVWLQGGRTKSEAHQAVQDTLNIAHKIFDEDDIQMFEGKMTVKDLRP